MHVASQRERGRLSMLAQVMNDDKGLTGCR